MVNADDFGFTPDVNQGIVEAHRRGILTATTLMANGAAFEDALRLAAETPSLDVGCHLVLIGGRSLPTGQPLPLTVPQLLAAMARREIRVYDELREQVRRIVDAGIRPTHLDSHRHLHAFSPFFVRVVKLAKRYDIPFIRWPYEDLPGSGWPAAGFSVRCLGWWLNRFCDLNEQIVEINRQTVNQQDVAKAMALLRSAKAGSSLSRSASSSWAILDRRISV